MFKCSEYNFIYDELGNDKVIFYNSRTGALASVQEEQYKQFQRLATTGDSIKDKDFETKLLECGYILPENVDEKFLIKTRMMKGRYNKETLSLTITPTMACNFRCIYCFEQGHYGNKMMDEETEAAVIAFIKNHSQGIKYMHVTWFGGEPLIGMPVIERLSEKILELCELKGIQYSSGIITNGYLLTRDVAERLKKYEVSIAQITVDGPKEIHDSRRPLVNGGGTYDVIMRNLCDVAGLINIKLRINVDVNNVDSADEVMDTLKQKNLLSYVHPYLALVLSFFGTYEADKCLTDENYSRCNLEFLLKHNLPLQMLYPAPKTNYCGADCNNAWVIDDRGYLYKCWNDVGNPSQSIGNVKLGQNYLQYTSLLEQYFSFDPTVAPECESCNLLPVCLGGCPNSRLSGRPVCEQTKYNMKEYLTACARMLLGNSKN